MHIDNALEMNRRISTLKDVYYFSVPCCFTQNGKPKKGIWNVLPTIDGDHMWLQGGLFHKHDIRAFYLHLLGMIEKRAVEQDSTAPNK